MNQIELGKTGLYAPPVGFGCAALMGRAGKGESLRALAAAWDEGIRFFDTARSYGYGESEALLGQFLGSRRQQAVIATKFGIMASPQPAWKKLARSVARTVLAVAPSTHKLLQKGAAGQFSHNQFTVPILRESIELSLSKLRTDYVDMLFIHAAPASVLNQDDLLEALGRLVESGKVRVAGMSSDPEVVREALDRDPPQLGAMQFPCNVFKISAATAFSTRTGGTHALVANHPFGGVARVQQCWAVLRQLAQDTRLDAALRAKLASEDDTLLADVVLNSILRDTGIHVVIPAMMKVHHIHANVRAVSQSRFTSAEIAKIRGAIVANQGSEETAAIH